MIKLSSLPPKMQKLVTTLITANDPDRRVPSMLPTRFVQPKDFPQINIERGMRRGMFPESVKEEEIPPVLVVGHELIQSEYRVLQPYDPGFYQVLAIDLAGLVDANVVAAHTTGRMSIQPAPWWNPRRDESRTPSMMVWDKKERAFLGKGSERTLYANEAELFSRHNLDARYDSPDQFKAFDALEVMEMSATLKVHRANFVIDGEDYQGWAWSIGHSRSAGTPWRPCATAKEGVLEARQFALAQVMHVDDPDPFFILATRNEEIRDELPVMAKSQYAARRREPLDKGRPAFSPEF